MPAQAPCDSPHSDFLGLQFRADILQMWLTTPSLWHESESTSRVSREVAFALGRFGLAPKSPVGRTTKSEADISVKETCLGPADSDEQAEFSASSHRRERTMIQWKARDVQLISSAI